MVPPSDGDGTQAMVKVVRLMTVQMLLILLAYFSGTFALHFINSDTMSALSISSIPIPHIERLQLYKLDLDLQIQQKLETKFGISSISSQYDYGDGCTSSSSSTINEDSVVRVTATRQHADDDINNHNHKSEDKEKKKKKKKGKSNKEKEKDEDQECKDKGNTDTSTNEDKDKINGTSVLNEMFIILEISVINFFASFQTILILLICYHYASSFFSHFLYVFCPSWMTDLADIMLSGIHESFSFDETDPPDLEIDENVKDLLDQEIEYLASNHDNHSYSEMNRTDSIFDDCSLIDEVFVFDKEFGVIPASSQDLWRNAMNTNADTKSSTDTSKAKLKGKRRIEKKERKPLLNAKPTSVQYTKKENGKEKMKELPPVRYTS